MEYHDLFYLQCTEAGLPTPCAINKKNKTPIHARISHGVDVANAVFKNSQTRVRMNIVKMHLDSKYVELESSRPLSELQNKNDGKLDQIHTVRDKVGADIVFLVGDTQGGRAYCNSNEEYAFGYVNVKSLGGIALPHEIGHIFGCQHDREMNTKYKGYALGFKV